MISWELFVIFLLILLNGFFAMSELALVSSRRVRLQQLANRGHRGARVALRLQEDPGRFLSTVQVGITLVGILAGAYGGATLAAPLSQALASVGVLAPYSDAIAIGLVVIAISYLSLIVGELVPKRVALRHAEPIAAFVARPMGLLARIAKPLVWFLSVSTEFVLRVLRMQETPKEGVTEEEVKALIDEGTQTGVFAPAEKDMIHGVLRLADRAVLSIMTPRRDVVWLDTSDPIDKIRQEIIESGYSRFPVAREELDEFLGVVDTKDLLDRVLENKPLDLQACLKQPLVVHENTHILRLLEMFKESAIPMAVIIDEYGTLQGIATMTDIVSAIAGDVATANEEEEPDAVQRDDGSWLMAGAMGIDDVERLTGLRGMRENEEYHTLAGFILSRLDHVPTVAESFEWNGTRFEIVDMDGHRIDRVLVTPAPPLQHPSENDAMEE